MSTGSLASFGLTRSLFAGYCYFGHHSCVNFLAALYFLAFFYNFHFFTYKMYLNVNKELNWIEFLLFTGQWTFQKYCECSHFYNIDSKLLVLTGSSAMGIPSEEEFVSTYCKLSGLGNTPIQHWNYYLALSFFRLAAITQVNNFQIL